MLPDDGSRPLRGVRRVQLACVAEHADEECCDRPTLTLIQKRWACCRRGAFEGHEWKDVDGDGPPLDELAGVHAGGSR